MTPYKSEDMMLTRVRSRDNGTMRLAIAFHRRISIGDLDRREQGFSQYVYKTTADFDEWATHFMGLPGLTPYHWGDDPQHKGLRELDMDPAARMKFMQERGPKRHILVLDTEEQAMLFKMRWQDES